MMTKSHLHNKLVSKAVLSSRKTVYHIWKKMAEKNRFQFSNFDEVFGKLQSVHRLKLGSFRTIVVPAILFFLFLGGVIAYRETGDFWVLPVCVLPFFVLFCGVNWYCFVVRSDELRIYENGFSYRKRKNLQICLWSEIYFYDVRELNEFEHPETDIKHYPLAYVKKRNGETITFDFYMTGTPLISGRSRNSKSKPQKKSGKSRNKNK